VGRTERVCFVLAGDPHEVEAGRLHRLLRRTYRAFRRAPGERNHIRARWTEEVAAGRAVFTGHVDGAEAIAACDAVVCPNLVPEPFGRTVAEAQTLGRPVLASCLPAFDELMEDLVSGRLLPLDAEAWARALVELSRDPALVRRLAEGGRVLASHYEAGDYAARMMKCYDEILEGPAR
jgi:glycosyltransferase involved in cell wall biosynthesis